MGRHGRRAALIAAICALSLALVAPIASAAVEVGDAGELPLTAQTPGPEGSLGLVSGALPNSEVDGRTITLDRDMYRICLTGAAFSASTLDGAGWDTQLFLFDETGRGVYANDDHSFPEGRGVAQSELPPVARRAGVYYLAISAFNWDPQSIGGAIFGRGAGVVDPTGDGASDPVIGWATARDRTEGGSYGIALTGARSCVDTTPPEIDIELPEDGAGYSLDEVVEARYSCSDNDPENRGVSCDGPVASGQPIDTATLGKKEFTVTARDPAGNVTTETRTYTVVDEAAPAITIASPEDGAAYARGALVTAVYSCVDEERGSGTVLCQGDRDLGAPVDTSTLGQKTFTVRARDAAGNESTLTSTYTVVDRTAPTIVLSSPADGATYARGERVIARFSCFDDAGGSGLVSCVGDRRSGARVDTSTPGEKTFTVRARDAAGNETIATATYRVEGPPLFDFSGFFWPVVNPPHVNYVKAGSIVPIRFSLHGFQGKDVIAAGYPRSLVVSCNSGAEGEEQPAHPAGRRRLIYRPRRDIYVFRWKTDRDWARTCRRFILKLSDGSFHQAEFRLLRTRRHGDLD